MQADRNRFTWDEPKEGVFFLKFFASLSMASLVGRRTSPPSVYFDMRRWLYRGRRFQRQLCARNRPHERPDSIPSPFREMAYRHGEGNDQGQPHRARIFRMPRIV